MTCCGPFRSFFVCWYLGDLWLLTIVGSALLATACLMFMRLLTERYSSLVWMENVVNATFCVCYSSPLLDSITRILFLMKDFFSFCFLFLDVLGGGGGVSWRRKWPPFRSVKSQWETRSGRNIKRIQRRPSPFRSFRWSRRKKTIRPLTIRKQFPSPAVWSSWAVLWLVAPSSSACGR